MDSSFRDGIPRFDGRDLLLEPCSRTTEFKVVLAAELGCCQAGWTRQGCSRDQCNSHIFFPPKAARCYIGQCLMALWHSSSWGAPKTSLGTWLPCLLPEAFCACFLLLPGSDRIWATWR